MSVAWTPSPRIRARAANAAVLRVNEGMVRKIRLLCEVLRMVGVGLLEKSCDAEQRETMFVKPEGHLICFIMILERFTMHREQYKIQSTSCSEADVEVAHRRRVWNQLESATSRRTSGHRSSADSKMERLSSFQQKEASVYVKTFTIYYLLPWYFPAALARR